MPPAARLASALAASLIISSVTGWPWAAALSAFLISSMVSEERLGTGVLSMDQFFSLPAGNSRSATRLSIVLTLTRVLRT